jgi:hypothetical protein
MIQLLRLLCGALIGLFQSSAREAEILVLRQQINVLRRKSPKRPALNNADRLLFVWLSRLVLTTLAALAVVSPETVIRWHRAGFRAYWRSQSRSRDPTAHSRHEHREPAMGRTTDPRRTSQARHRCRANDGGQIYGNYQKPHPGLERDEQHVGHLETHAHPA